jgi:Protein of unknown function (DUF2735)
MTTAPHLEPAKIYEFPAGAPTSRNRAGARSAAHPASPKTAKAEYGSGWYHDAAIEEAEHTTELARPVRLFTDRI